MSTELGIVIVGGGLAGARAAEGTSAAGYEGPVPIIAGEDAMPYIRPPLSKEVLIGTGTRDAIDVHPADLRHARRNPFTHLRILRRDQLSNHERK